MMFLPQRMLLLLSFCIMDMVLCQHGSHSGYSRKNYQNPMKEPLLCGRDRVEKSYVCDPDGILVPANKEASRLDSLIAQIINETTCPCSSYSCGQNRDGYKIGIALIQKMEFDDVNRHEEHHGDDEDLETKKRNIVQNLNQAQLYANDIHQRWMLGRCDEDVIIFYSKEDNVVYTATGDIARMKLSNEIVALVAKDALHLGFYKSPFDGLLKIVNDYRLVFLNSYHRKPTTGESKYPNFGVSSVMGQASIVLTCVLFMLGFVLMQ